MMCVCYVGMNVIMLQLGFWCDSPRGHRGWTKVSYTTAYRGRVVHAEEAEERRCRFVIELPHIQAVAGRMAFSEIVGEAELVGAPNEGEVA